MTFLSLTFFSRRSTVSLNLE